MARKSEQKRIAVVTGDVTIDWNLAHARSGDDAGAAWSAEDATEGYVQPGGAALLGELIHEAAQLPGGPRGFDVRRVDLPSEALVPRAPGLYHSYAFWSRYKQTRDKGPDTWRVKEFLGLDRPRSEPQREGDPRAVDQDPPEAEVVVLDDAGLDFRKDEARWPEAIKGEAGSSEGARSPWVVLKMAEPVADGELWKYLLANFAERLIVVMTANDLRLSEAQISRALSWERTAHDLAGELVSNPRINALSHCANVVVSLNTDGALLLSRLPTPGRREGEQRRPECELFFDPQMLEGMWAEQHPGRMVGYTSCLTAAIALQLMLAADGAEPDLHAGIRRGLEAMRALHLRGYGAPEEEDQGDEGKRARLRFPNQDIAQKLIGEAEPREKETFSRRLVPPPSFDDWTILRSRYPAGLEFGGLAARIAQEGAEAVLEDVPLGRFGSLTAVDRKEIEGYQSIRALIEEYRRWPVSRPLSVAVFGPPGSGKSFGVVQVAKSLGKEFEKLEFNLSQLNDPAELHGAFHQVRDKILRGSIPLVFWDEFDTKLGDASFGWLRHFLAPMQDGEFLEGELLHPIGRAIFVFAGGTSKRMEEFREKAMRRPDAKGRDFVSRLKGYVDVVGPNPRDDDPEADPYHQIRRAIILRSVLERDRKNLFEERKEDGRKTEILTMDPGVLRAFLRTREYKHGARSLESIVAMSALHGQTKFERSCLPAREQLDMHVDADDFLELATQHEPDPQLIEDLAEATHVRFCRRRLLEGYRWNGETVEYLRDEPLLREFADKAYEGALEKSTLVSWDELSEEDREQNRSQVRRIPSELEGEGYVMRKARSAVPGSARFEPDPEAIERLAEREHERWLKAKLDARWRWAEVRDDKRKRHPDMLPWRELDRRERWRRYGRKADRVGLDALPDPRKEEDRAIAQAMAETIAAAGYEIVRVREPGAVVGVTGHRILSEPERLEASVRDTLERIEQAFPDEPLIALSALAEGADRLVADGVLNRGGSLRAVLPLPAGDYENDFGEDSSKAKFQELLGKAAEVVELPAAESREAAYEAGGRYVLDRCDVLVAIWDGQGAQGQGGTGGTVAEARERGLPIAWIHAGNRKPGTEEPTSLGEEQGTVTFENWER